MNIKNELNSLVQNKFIGKKILNQKDFEGLTIKTADLKVSVNYSLQITLSFNENNKYLIIDEEDNIELS